MVHILKDENGNSIGWELRPITDEEQKIAGSIRDLAFLGFDETAIKYAGLKLIDNAKGVQLGNIKSLTWKQQQFIKND
jgi:hypothetical protein